MVILLLLAFAGVCACADTEILQSGDFRYILLEDGSAAIIAAETEGELVIPAELDGHPVASLGLDSHPDVYLVYKAAGLLDENRTLVRGVVSGNCTGITLPDSLTAIGSCAFTDCVNLKYIVLPDSVVSIGSSAFLRCGLESVSVPEGVTRLKPAVFRQCKNLRSVTLPSTLTAIDDYAFEQCASLTEISIPEGVKTIGTRALAGCRILRNVVLPDSLEDMKDDTFAESFNILCTITSASYGSRYCQYFGIPIRFPGENAPVSGLLKNGPFRYVVLEDDTAAIISAEADGVLVFPSMLDGHPVSAIGLENSASLYQLYEEAGLRNERSEYSCVIGNGCTAAVIPEGVTLIGKSAFQNCDRLVSVSLPSTLKTIGSSAFMGCSSLDSLILPDGLTDIMAYAFQGCQSLSSVLIPDSVTDIGAYAFFGSGLTFAVIPEAVTAIEERTFAECKQLQYVTLPKRLETIGDYAFSGCTALSSLAIPDSVTDIGSNAFASTGLTSVVIPEGVTALKNGVFQNCEKLISVTLPSGLTEIGEWAFSFCRVLETLSIPESVTNISRNAFSASSRLTCVVPTDSAALSFCRSNSVRYSIDPASYGITRSGDYQYILLEDDTAAILTAEAEDVLIIPAELDGHPVTAVGLDDTNKTEELYKAAGLKQDQGVVSGCTGVTIPDSVTVIGKNAFRGCENLASVTLGKSIAQIETGAFRDCRSLSGIQLPESLQHIGVSAFQDCAGLTEISIPDGVLFIGDSAFQGCENLAAVTLPANLTFLGNNALMNCGKLTGISLPENLNYLGKHAFSGTGLTSVTVPGSVYTVEEQAFGSCASLRSIVLEEGVSIIGKQAFYHCGTLTEITLPGTLTKIGDQAFCETNPGIVALPGSLTEIGNHAFDYCPRLICAVGTNFSAIKYCVENGISYKLLPEKSGVIRSGIYQYVLLEDDTAAILTADADGKLTLPAALNKYPVVSLGLEDHPDKDALYKAAGLTGSDGAVLRGVIGKNCPEITFPAGLVTIGTYAFTDSAVSSVRIPRSVASIAPAAFFRCPGLESLTLPETITVLKEDTFRQCEKLASVTIPEGVESIGARAFEGCVNLERAELPDSLQEIGENAFGGCEVLRCVVSMQSRAEALCTAAEIPFLYYELSSPGSAVLKSGDFDYIVLEDGSAAIIRAETNGELFIPAMLDRHPVTAIGLDEEDPLREEVYSAAGIMNYNSLNTRGVIGRNCTQAVIPESVTTIGFGAFSCCANLKTIVIPSGVKTIGNNAFSECTGLAEITLPAGLETIGEGAFWFCQNLTSLEIPDSVTSIGEFAFSDTGLTSIRIPEGVTTLSPFILSDCLNLQSVILPEDLEIIGSYAFEQCGALTGLSIPYTVRNIGKSAFAGCGSLTCTVAENSHAQRYCEENRIPFEIDPQSVGVIHEDENVPQDSPLIRSGNYQYILRQDGSAAIITADIEGDCVLPSELDGHPVTAIGLNRGDPDIEKSYLASGLIGAEGEYSSRNGVFRNTLTGITIPSGITTIGIEAFCDCDKLQSVVLPDDITEIGAWAFSGCMALTSVTVPDGLQTIGESAFSCCFELTSIRIPDSVTTIQENAFFACTGLTRLEIPAGVETIADDAFESCDSLVCVVVKNSPAHQFCISNGLWYETMEAPDPFAGFRNPFDGLPDPLPGSRNP